MPPLILAFSVVPSIFWLSETSCLTLLSSVYLFGYPSLASSRSIPCGKDEKEFERM